MKYSTLLFILSLLFITSPFVSGNCRASEEYFITNNSNGDLSPIIGETVKLIYSGNKSFFQISRKYDLGYLEIRDANPDFDDTYLSGEELLLPTSWIVPEIMDEGILINLAELRLYFFKPVNDSLTSVRTFPIGIGRSGYETPTGTFRVTRKVEDPIWFPPPSLRKRHPSLPESVPPGKNNPLGRYWIQLSLRGYGIHGTNIAGSIGKRVSMGCIRLFDENIEWLFNQVYRGMKVKIVNMPVKLGYLRNRPYLEIDKNGFSDEEIKEKAWQILHEKNLDHIDTGVLNRIIDEGFGVPVPILETGPSFTGQEAQHTPKIKFYR